MDVRAPKLQLRTHFSGFTGTKQLRRNCDSEMILYRTKNGCYVEEGGQFYHLAGKAWDGLILQDDLAEYLLSIITKEKPVPDFARDTVLAPIGNQEVWAAGVTYDRSRTARIEESKDAKGGDFYDRVYSAERPELFFKAIAGKVAGPDSKVRIRRDSSWSVPEPELTILANSKNKVVGYTIGNDMSSRDIEGENPLYLPQAKMYDGSCALGPGVLVTQDPLPPATQIQMTIEREGRVEFSGSVALERMKRRQATLLEYLFRENTFPYGCFLMTGTGIVPPDTFTLRSGDRIRITIGPIGTLANEVA
jgi:2-dehydro-3-deoxy-D-arabinonate dehydratase